MGDQPVARMGLMQSYDIFASSMKPHKDKKQYKSISSIPQLHQVLDLSRVDMYADPAGTEVEASGVVSSMQFLSEDPNVNVRCHKPSRPLIASDPDRNSLGSVICHLNLDAFAASRLDLMNTVNSSRHGPYRVPPPRSCVGCLAATAQNLMAAPRCGASAVEHLS